MGFFDIFKKKDGVSAPNEIHLGDRVKCRKCGAMLSAKPMEIGKIAVGTPADLQGFALRCSECDLIVCSKCAMPMQTKPCPSCGKDFVAVVPKWPRR